MFKATKLFVALVVALVALPMAGPQDATFSGNNTAGRDLVGIQNYGGVTHNYNNQVYLHALGIFILAWLFSSWQTYHHNFIDKDSVDCNEWGKEMLLAAEMGEVKKFIRAVNCPGADINYQKSGGSGTSLWRAALHGYVQVVKYLLSIHQTDVKKGGGIHVVTGETGGSSPLFVASQFGHVEVVRALLANDKINVNQATTDDGETPLIMASQEGHVEVVRALLANLQINVNQGNKNGTTPLFFASQNGHVEVVRALLAHSQIKVNQATTGVYRITPCSWHPKMDMWKW